MNAVALVFQGAYLPAHDEVFDRAERIAEDVATLRAYIARVRDPEQADLAVRELLDGLKG